MPYWNWGDDRIPPLFFDKSTPFYHRQRDAGPDSKISDYIGLSVKVGNRDADFLGRPGRQLRLLLRRAQPRRSLGQLHGFG